MLVWIGEALCEVEDPATARREQINRGMKFGALVAAGIAVPEGDGYRHRRIPPGACVLQGEFPDTIPEAPVLVEEVL